MRGEEGEAGGWGGMEVLGSPPPGPAHTTGLSTYGRVEGGCLEPGPSLCNPVSVSVEGGRGRGGSGDLGPAPTLNPGRRQRTGRRGVLAALSVLGCGGIRAGSGSPGAGASAVARGDSVLLWLGSSHKEAMGTGSGTMAGAPHKGQRGGN